MNYQLQKITDEEKRSLINYFSLIQQRLQAKNILHLTNTTAIRIQNRSLSIQENFNKVAKLFKFVEEIKNQDDKIRSILRRLISQRKYVEREIKRLKMKMKQKLKQRIGQLV